MTAAYRRFLKKNIDLSPLGIEQGREDMNYFCTPKGANIIGYAGVDGIHYCFIRGFGETVFAVSPMSTPGHYVHPVAGNFEDFLRLLLSCGSEAALEQMYAWDLPQLEAFLRDNTVTEEQQKVLERIRRQMNLTPMENPFSYVRKLQKEFDYKKIKFTEDYYEWVPAEPKIPEWKVYFEGDFRGRHGRDHAGREIPVNREFVWGGNHWLIPSVYSCSRGLVVDFCIRIPAEQIRAFMEKWYRIMENSEGQRLTREQQMELDAENPTSIEFRPHVVVNGRTLHANHGCGRCWNPCISKDEAQEPAAQSAVKHYGLNPEDGWVIHRASFSWDTKQRPEIKSLGITLKPEPVSVPGPHFIVAAPGDSFEFEYPLTGEKYTLTVREYEQQEMPQEQFGSTDMEYPTYYTVMSYTVTPELPDNAFTICDCADSDSPRQKQGNPHGPEMISSAACVAVIGGADGPTSVFLAASGQGKLRAACSALHFKPVKEVEWRMVFCEKRLDDMVVSYGEMEGSR